MQLHHDNPCRHFAGAYRAAVCVAGSGHQPRLQNGPAGTHLLLPIEIPRSAASVEEQSMRFGEIAAELGGGPFVWTTVRRSAPSCGRRATTQSGIFYVMASTLTKTVAPPRPDTLQAPW